MLTLAIFDCNADELIIDPALRAKWHIDLISAHDVIDNGISAGIIAAFVKADRFIFERTAATNSANGQVNHLLTWSNADDFVVYQPVFIHYNDKVIPGCSSHDFMRKDEMLIPFERLHRAYEGRGLAQALTKFDSPADRIAYTVGFVERVTNLTGVGAYLTAILELDCLTLNEDRHTNNLAVLRNEETKEFRLCPIFDNGLSLLSDLNDYPLTDDLYTCIERVQAKPFDSDHVEQVTAAEQLYGRQLTFRISHGELRSELNLLSEAYSPDILQRAERVLLEQKRKHSWLF